MKSRLNMHQAVVLEYELERYPDIVPIVLQKMRMKTVAELTSDRFVKFFHEVQKEKFQKYGKVL